MWCPKCHSINDPGSTHCKVCTCDLRETLAVPKGEDEAPKELSRQSYAGFWIRFSAFILDLIIVVLGSIGVAAALFIFLFPFGEASLEKSGESLGYWTALAVNWLYKAGMESSAHRATIGKMALG